MRLSDLSAFGLGRLRSRWQNVCDALLGFLLLLLIIQVAPQRHVLTATTAPTAADFSATIDQIGGKSPTLPIRLSRHVALTVTGWAAATSRHSLATSVDLVIDSQQRFLASDQLDRPDVATAFHSDAIRLSGFTATIPADALRSGRHTVVIEVVAGDGSRAMATRPVAFDMY